WSVVSGHKQPNGQPSELTNEPFDIIGMFDVLEHLEDDIDILSHLFRLLKPGGRLVLTVPAHMSLWSYFDETACHFRRYKRRGLCAKLAEVGFEPEFVTEFMMTLFPLVWLGRRLNRLSRNPVSSRNRISDQQLFDRELRVVPVVNSLLRWFIGVES